MRQLLWRVRWRGSHRRGMTPSWKRLTRASWRHVWWRRSRKLPNFYAPSEAPPFRPLRFWGRWDRYRTTSKRHRRRSPSARTIVCCQTSIGEDASIAQYMEQLLQRLGVPHKRAVGICTSCSYSAEYHEQAEQRIGPREVTRQAAAPASQHPRRWLHRPHLDTDYDEESQNLTGHDYVDSDMISLDMGDGMRRRTVPPEFSSDLMAMRELANISARSAIDRM